MPRLKRLFSRTQLETEEVNILRGIARHPPLGIRPHRFRARRRSAGGAGGRDPGMLGRCCRPKRPPAQRPLPRPPPACATPCSACRWRRKRKCRICSACWRWRPARRLLAGVSGGWEHADPKQVEAWLQRWRSHRIGTAAHAYQACTTWFSALVCRSGQLGRDRLSRPDQGAAGMSAIPIPDTSRPGARLEGRRRRPLTADRTFDADVVIVGSGAGGGVTAEILALSGLSVIVGRGRAEVLARFQDARSRSLPRAVPGIGRAQDARQGHQHPAGPHRGRLDHRQLDLELPHPARHHPEVLAAALRPEPTTRRKRWRPGSR
jgi:hypothetical protein